jgi:hypothetical protein
MRLSVRRTRNVIPHYQKYQTQRISNRFFLERAVDVVTPTADWQAAVDSTPTTNYYHLTLPQFSPLLSYTTSFPYHIFSKLTDTQGAFFTRKGGLDFTDL